MSPRTARLVAWGLWAVALATLAAGISVSAASEGLDMTAGPWIGIGLVEATVGALILARVPKNPIGWILCALALGASLSSLADAYVTR